MDDELAGSNLKLRRGTRVERGVPTLRDVARIAGVSTATVSRALTHPALVRAEVRQRVEDAARALGYVSNGAGRALASARSGLIGILVPEIRDRFHEPVVAGVVDALRASRYVAAIVVGGDNAAASLDGVRRLLSLGVEGIVSVGSGQVAVAATLAMSRGTAFVDVEGDTRRDPDAISLDFDRGAETVVRYLHELGHRRFVLLRGAAAGAAALEVACTEAYQRAFSRVSDAVVIEARLASGDAAGASLLCERVLMDPVSPTAIVCTDDLLALGAIKACALAGRAVPANVSVAGCGDGAWARYATPPLTSLRLPLEEAGRAAATRVLTRLGTPPPSTGDASALPRPAARLIVRGTTGRARS